MSMHWYLNHLQYLENLPVSVWKSFGIPQLDSEKYTSMFSGLDPMEG